MSSSSYTALNALTDIITSPSQAFDGIKDHNSWFWWPLLISVALTCCMLAYYYSWVDFEWLVDRTIQNLPAEEREASGEAVRSFMSRNSSIMLSLVFVVLSTLVIYLLMALYFHLANKATTGAVISYGQWFNFSAWANFVGVFGAIAGFVVILMASSNQLPAEDLQVFSANKLILNARPGDPWFNWGSFVNLMQLWVIALCTIGFARWTGASLVKAGIISALPWVVIFGIWAALI